MTSKALCAGTVDDFSAHVCDTYIKTLVVEDKWVPIERLRALRSDREIKGATYFRFTPVSACCYGCGEQITDPITATQPSFLARSLFVAFCQNCLKTPTT